MNNSRILGLVYILVMLVAILLMWFKIDPEGIFIYLVFGIGAVIQIAIQFLTVKKWNSLQWAYLACDVFTILIIGIHFLIGNKVHMFLIFSLLLRFLISTREAKRKMA